MTLPVLLLAILISACSRQNIILSGKLISEYVGEYEYPDTVLNAGDGTVSVPATGILKCSDSNGLEVDLALCPPPSEAPPLIVKSPAGTVNIPVTGSVGGTVAIPVGEGEDIDDYTQDQIDDLVESNIVCDIGYVAYGPNCRIPGYELYYSNYSSPASTDVCSGSEILSRSVLGCRDSVTYVDVSATNCNGMTDPSPTINYQSPSGTRDRTVGSDTIHESCGLGLTVWSQTDITCGDQYQHKVGPDASAVCQDDLFTPSDFTYPANTLTAGQGSVTLDADGFVTCTNTTKSTSAPLVKCSMPAVVPTINYDSPAGSRDVVSGTDTVHESCDEGATVCTQTDITCGNPEQHKSGTGALAVCIDDVFTPSDFTYPANTLTAGEGSLIVDATGFNTCTNTTKSTNATLAKCSMPAVVPTTTYLSPAGNREVIDGLDTIYESCDEGATVCTQTDIDCGESGETKYGSGSTAICTAFIPSDFTYPANTLAVGEGTQDVDANGFNTCTAFETSEVVDNSYCSLPTVLPTETQMSPSGEILIAIDNAVGGGVQYPVVEGEDFSSILQTTKESYIDQNLVCLSNYMLIDHGCHIGALDVVSMANETCVLTSAGTLKCAGLVQYNASSPEAGYAPLPVEILTGGFKIDSVTSRGIGSHLCVLLDNGTPRCMGSNQFGELGDGTTQESPSSFVTPLFIDGGLTVSKIFTGPSNTCVIMSDDSVRCLGMNLTGKIGKGSTSTMELNYLVYPLGGKTPKDIAIGFDHICVLLTDNSSVCSGLNTYGQLATGNQSRSYAPISTIFSSGADNFVSIHAGAYMTCLLSDIGKLFCSGRNQTGQLGLPVATTYVVNPTQTDFGRIGERILFFDEGANYNCVKFEDGEIRCSGINNYGQLATGTVSSYEDAPVEAIFNSQGINVAKINSGYYTTCAISDDHKVWCVGKNSLGEIGNGLQTDSLELSPTRFLLE